MVGGRAFAYFSPSLGREIDTEVDAGFQFSMYNNWWTSFVSVNGSAYCYENCAGGAKPPGGTPNNKGPGNKQLEFYVAATDRVSLYTADIGFLGIQSNQRTVVFTAVGWRQDGFNQRLKRTTSVTEIDGDGYGYSTSTRFKMYPVQWRGTEIGIYGGAMNRWTNVQEDGIGRNLVRENTGLDIGWLLNIYNLAEEDIGFSYQCATTPCVY